jgi:hypothetical protein
MEMMPSSDSVPLSPLLPAFLKTKLLWEGDFDYLNLKQPSTALTKAVALWTENLPEKKAE